MFLQYPICFSLVSCLWYLDDACDDLKIYCMCFWMNFNSCMQQEH